MSANDAADQLTVSATSRAIFHATDRPASLATNYATNHATYYATNRTYDAIHRASGYATRHAIQAYIARLKEKLNEF